jgi:pimeloyl-ACP methyl ester carboxylesterase
MSVAEHRLRRPASELAYTIRRPDDAASDAAPIVLLHGWGSSRADWDRVIIALASDPRTADRVVLAVDMPGHGESTIEGPITVAGFVDDVDAVMAAESLTGAVAIGHSLGGTMALELAVRHPDRVSQVIGSDTYHYLQVYPRQTEEEVEAFAGGFTRDLEASVRGLVDLSSWTTTAESTKEHVRQSTLRAAQQPQVVELLIDGLRWDLDAALVEVASQTPAIPVSAIVAEPLFSAEARERYGSRIAFATFPDRGHYFPMEDPEGAAEAYAAALR